MLGRRARGRGGDACPTATTVRVENGRSCHAPTTVAVVSTGHLRPKSRRNAEALGLESMSLVGVLGQARIRAATRWATCWVWPFKKWSALSTISTVVFGQPATAADV